VHRSTVFRLLSLLPASLLPFCAGVPAIGVGQPARFACRGNWSKRSDPSALGLMSPPVSFQSRVVGVTHPPQSLSDVRGADARSAQIGSPCGVARSFQVSLYKVEPAEAVLARNLLSKDNWRAALCNEPEELWPEVSGVGKAGSLSGCAKRLAGAASGPDWAVVGPPGEAQGVAPDADPGEEVALNVRSKVIWRYINNAPLVHVAWRDVPSRNQVTQPLRCKRV
jgi:hypothetical protein